MHLLTLAALLALLPVPALAENWQRVGEQEGVTFDLDLDSIHTVDGGRYFRIRVRTSSTDPTTGYYDSVADCTVHQIDTLHSETAKAGHDPIVHDFKPGEKQTTMDPALIPLVCGK
jgi:hypothetical protein